MNIQFNNIINSRKILYILFIFFWLILAINPQFRDDWLLENILVFILFPTVVWLDKKYKFSIFAFTLIFLFGTAHIIGAHFTYSQMYYFDIVTNFFNFERNHYDRVVHFLFGLLITLPFYEILLHNFKSKIALSITFLLIISISSIYEQIEWIIVELFYQDLGISFLGAQGDIWDAQKDISLSIIGAFITIIIIINKNIK
jgi:putative membrane protein